MSKPGKSGTNNLIGESNPDTGKAQVANSKKAEELKLVCPKIDQHSRKQPAAIF